MRRIILLILFTIGISTNIFVHPAFAQNAGAPLTVEPLYPENQVQTVKGYFRLKVQPNQKQTLNVRLKNNLDQNQTVIIKPANGYTNPVGGMLYSEKVESEDSILLDDAINLAEFLEVDSEIILNPSETRKISIQMTTPNIEKGTVLGGIRFVTEGKSANEEIEGNEGEANFVLKTETVHAIAVQLDYSHQPMPNFSLGKAGFIPTGPSVFIEMKNDTQMIQENISGQYQVLKANGDSIFDGDIPSFKMAPKTQIRYPIQWMNETLENGNYQIKLTMKVNGREVLATEDFTIGQEEVNEYVERTQPIVPQAEEEEVIPGWIWIIAGAIVLAGIMFWLGMRRKTNS